MSTDRQDNPHEYFVKYDLEEDFMSVSVGKRGLPSEAPLLLVEAKSSVTLEKQEDLLLLCKDVIPTRYHDFFQNLRVETPEQRARRLLKKEKARVKLAEKAEKANKGQKKEGVKTAEKGKKRGKAPQKKKK